MHRGETVGRHRVGTVYKPTRAASEETSPDHTLISDSQPPQLWTVHFGHLSCPGCGMVALGYSGGVKERLRTTTARAGVSPRGGCLLL